MNSTLVEIKKADLLDTLKKNRENHKKNYEEAMAEFKKDNIEKLTKFVKKARKGEDVHVMIGHDKPKEYLADYDRVIRMVEMDISETWKMTEQEFNMYIMDKWNWAPQFEASTMSYVNKQKLSK